MLFVPARLRYARDAAGLTLSDVGEAVGRSDATICRYESGEIAPTSVMLGRLAALYCCAVADFFTADGVEQVQPAEALAGVHDGR